MYTYGVYLWLNQVVPWQKPTQYCKAIILQLKNKVQKIINRNKTKWIPKKLPLRSMGTSAQCYIAAWMGGELYEEWTHVYICLRPFAVHLSLLQHC